MQTDPLRRAQGTGRVAPGDSAVRTLDDDTAFRLLGNGRRRAVIRHLAAASEPVRLAELANAVAARERGEGGTDPAGAGVRATRRRVTVTLEQVHLPKLAEADVITYDRETAVATPTPTLDALADRLARSTGELRGVSPAVDGRSLFVRAAAALAAAALTMVVVSERVAAALSTAAPALAASTLVALAVFAALTLASRPSDPARVTD